MAALTEAQEKALWEEFRVTGRSDHEESLEPYVQWLEEELSEARARALAALALIPDGVTVGELRTLARQAREKLSVGQWQQDV